jgi:ribonuclease-3
VKNCCRKKTAVDEGEEKKHHHTLMSSRLIVFDSRLGAIDIHAPAKDPKTRLQEWLQARRHPLPRYAVVEISGEAHAQRFEVECTIEAPALRSRGSGTSRRTAEQSAAEAAWRQLAERP